MTNQMPFFRSQTGVEGLDNILGGGLVTNRLYLLEGEPGTGKTTLAMQFLLQGRKQNEKVLYITLSETIEELRSVADSHGWNLDGIDLYELNQTNGLMEPDQEITLFHPWEFELGETVKSILNSVESLNPTRVVFDSLSELRLLAQDSLRYRRQILSFKQFFAGRNCTVLMLDDRTGNNGRTDQDLHSIAHGVISLERLTLDFGAARRRLEIQKMRGVDFRAGWHDLVIRHGGLIVYPRLVALEHHRPFVGDSVPSGSMELDALMDGGPLRGTSALITGPAGSAKTSISLLYAVAAAQRGERVCIYEFDERLGTMITRSKKIGMDIQPYLDSGKIDIRQIDPAEISPGEFASIVRHEVEHNEAQILIIDSLNGYLNAMPQEKQLILQLHELLSYLNQQGVLTLLINPQYGLVGTMRTNLDVSYIADTVILLRFFETEGAIRKAISIIKNRSGNHENTIREVYLDSNGIHFSNPLRAFQGIMTGTPQFTGDNADLIPAFNENVGDDAEPSNTFK